MKLLSFKSLCAVAVLMSGSAALAKSINRVRITATKADNPMPERIHILPYIAEEFKREEVSQTPGATLSGIISASESKGWEPGKVFEFDIEPIAITIHPQYSELEIIYGCLAAEEDIRRYFMQDDIEKLAESNVLVINLDEWEAGITLEAINQVD